MNSGDSHSGEAASARAGGTRRWRWLSGGVLLLLFSPILAALVWYLSARISNSRAIARLELEARQRGEPVTLAELQAMYPPIPDANNAAAALLALWEKEDPSYWTAFRTGARPLTERSPREVDPAVPILGSKAAPVARGEPLDAASLVSAREYLRREADHMAEARAALQRSPARFPLNFGEGFDLLQPHLAVLKRETQDFRLAALVAAEDGEVDAAIVALRDTARMGQILAEDPLLISHLVRIACLANTITGIEDLMSRRRLDAAQLEQLKSVLAETKADGGLKRSLIGERAFALSIFDRSAQAAAALSTPDGTGSAMRSQKFAIGAMKIIGLAAADKRLMLETFNPAIVAAEQDMPEALKKIEEVFRAAAVKAQQFPPRIFSRMLLPSLARAAEKFAAQEARRRAALVAVAIQEYRLQHAGRLPERLEQLVPQFLATVPTDPFDGQPMRYQLREKGFVVYSTGADGKDNGGRERMPGKGGSQNIDDTFIVDR